MPECDHQYVNVVRLLVPPAEITAEMHRRAIAQNSPEPSSSPEDRSPSPGYSGNFEYIINQEDKIQQSEEDKISERRIRRRDVQSSDRQSSLHHISIKVPQFPKNNIQKMDDSPPEHKSNNRLLPPLNVKRHSHKHGRGGAKSWNSRSPSPSTPTLTPGYEQYRMSLLEVPWCHDYGDASSDDLSSEWDSDVPEQPSTPSLPKVLVLFQFKLNNNVCTLCMIIKAR